MKLQYLALCALGLAILVPNQSNADIMALYEFDSTYVDGSLNERGNSRDLNPDILAGDYNTRTNRVAADSDGGIAPPQSDVHAFARTNKTPDDIRIGPNNVYHEFDVTILNGTWTMDSLHFEYWVNDSIAGQEYRATVYSDLVGYGTGQELDTQSYVRQTNQIPEIHTVSIGGLQFQTAFQEIAEGTTATFRIVFSDNVDLDDVVHRIDDVELRGFEVQSVPEPAVGSILLLVGGLLSTRRRRR
ncbi:PEP-CTERM sorting domain-containing protein [Mariniblastus fucicola]|uniref:PEP-CTERM sorting domain-containing protein n=1 Tax=Mariniblastus fucicola TaxID=980251 RepID=UPI00094683D9|nr:PEP-CTERM sorting domain-containing protein [Mariniblastus fucicola]